MDFEYIFGDAFEFAARVAKSPEVVGQEMNTATDRTSMQGEGWTKEGTPVRTGHLRRTIAYNPARFAGGVSRGGWGTETPYAPAVEDGRGPIVAGPGKVLRFVPKGGNTAIYRKRVGPARAHHMFANAMKRLQPVMLREFDGAIIRIIRRMGGA